MDRQTDRRTDGRTSCHSIVRAYVSRGKNWWTCRWLFKTHFPECNSNCILLICRLYELLWPQRKCLNVLDAHSDYRLGTKHIIVDSSCRKECGCGLLLGLAAQQLANMADALTSVILCGLTCLVQCIFRHFTDIMFIHAY